MSTAPDPQQSVRTLQDDLVGTGAVDGIQVASFGLTWQVLNLWRPASAARRGPVRTAAVCLAVLAAVVVTGFLAPGLVWIPLLPVVGHLVVATGVAACIRFRPSWVLLVDAQHTAVIGFRIWHQDGLVHLVLDSHLARRPGTGQGRRLRERLAGRLGAVLARHPGTLVRFRARNEHLAAVYLTELEAVLPDDQGWNHRLDGTDGTVHRVESAADLPF